MADISTMNIEFQRSLDIQSKKTVLEINYVLPDNRPRIVSVEHSFVTVGVRDIAVSGDIAEFTLSAQADLIYNALAVSEEEEHLFSTACRLSKSFKETADIELSSPDDNIRSYSVQVNIENVETTLISDRKVNMKIHVILFTRANIYCQADCISSFEDPRTVSKSKQINGIISLGSKKVQSFISEEVELDSTLPEIENILCKSVAVQIENQKAVDNKMIFYGTAHVDMVFSCHSDGCNFFSTGFDISFNQACEFDHLNESARSNIACNVSDVSIDTVSKGTIKVTMLISFDVEAFDNYAQTLTEDAFLPGADVSIKKSSLSFENDIIISENIGVCSDKLSVENGDIDKILLSTVTVKECTSYIRNKNICLDGIYDIKTLYVPQSDPNIAKCAYSHVPFSYMTQTQADTGFIVTGNVDVKGVTAQKNDFGEIQLKWVADIKAIATDKIIIDTVSEIELTEAHTTKRELYYHRIGENEALWDIAKRFKVSPNELCRLNNINENDDISQLKGIIVMVNM